MTNRIYNVHNTLVFPDSAHQPDPAQREAIAKVLDDAHGPVVNAADGSIRCETPWEPPLDSFKQIVRDYPELPMRFYGEAFADQHWICVATASGGKVEAETVTRVDGKRFETIFEEIFGESYHQWEKRNAG